MNQSVSKWVIAALMLSGAGHAQDRGSASPTLGNAQRGRELLAILGPKPHDAAGISPLQQQELNRRVRCAATREEIQQQLDFLAAGSSGFYSLAQLRAAESQLCMPPPDLVLPPLPLPTQSAPRSPAIASTKLHPAKVAAAGPSYTPAPNYPPSEMAAGHGGVVLVQLVINPDGSVKTATLAKSSNYPVLDAAALLAVKAWRIPAAAGRTIDVPLTFSSH